MLRLPVMILCVMLFCACKKTDSVFTSTSVNAQAVVDDKIIADYVKANNLTTAVHVGSPKVDTIGVWYIVEDAGTAPALYTSSSTITVGFTGKVLGSVNTFATSANTAGVNPSFIIGQTIKGWQLGIQAAKINKGGRLRIIMASRYAYGPFPQSQYGLPPNSVLDFELNMYDVTN